MLGCVICRLSKCKLFISERMLKASTWSLSQANLINLSDFELELPLLTLNTNATWENRVTKTIASIKSC